MRRSDFEARLAESRVYERAVARRLRRQGGHVLPTYDYSGADDDKAPRLEAPDGFPDLVIPDLLVWQARRGFWFEVKVKGAADEWRREGRLVTGFSTRLWRMYHEVQRVTAIPVQVAFVHLQEGEVRCASIDRLSTVISHQYPGRKMGRHGMTFFRYSRIPRWCWLDELGVREAA